MGSDLLLTAFENFRRASSSLETVHRELSQKVLHLSRRLEEKNRELERNLAEKEEIRSFLDAILSSMANGVLVSERSGRIRTANAVFRDLVAKSLGKPGKGAALRRGDVIPGPLLAPLRKLLAGREHFDEITLGEQVFMVTATRFRPAPAAEELFIFVFNDITELRKLQEEQESQARLSAMGEMAIQLAHEIRNPLGGVQLYASLLRTEHSPEERREWARNIEAGLALINTMVTNMLRFYKPIRLSPGFVRPIDILEESAALMEPIIARRGIQLIRRDDYEGEVIQADPEMLKQVVMNLLKNAMNAMPEGGSITLSAAGPLADREGSDVPFCLIACEDTGVGMDSAEVDRMFEPFWSSQTDGYGIGLWVSGQIIRQHRGQIVVDSRKGGGTRVQVLLPVHFLGEAHEG